VVGASVVSCGGPEEPIVATAEGHRLTVEETASVFMSAPRLPDRPEVVDAFADLWVNYTLLAEAVTRDSTLRNLDLDPLLETELERERILALMEARVRPDTTISEEEVARYFDEEAPGLRVRARHIVLAYPPDPTAAQRDSVRSEIEDLRERALAGEDFARLAERFSQDRGSAPQGGDLGFWRRGEMLAPLDRVAFSLEPDEVSEPVETAYGLHILRLEERHRPTLEGTGEEVRAALAQEIRAEAESTFVAELEAGTEIEFAEEAVELTRRVAADPQLPLSSRALDRTLVDLGSTEVTLDDVRDVMRTRDASWRAQVYEADDEAVREGVLRQLAQRALLLRAAEEDGIELPAERRAILGNLARDNFVQAAGALGLADIRPTAGESRREAVERTVLARLREIALGQRDPSPLGPASFVLRKQFRASVLEPGVLLAAERIRRERGPDATARDGELPPALQPAQDSAGGG